MKIWQKVPKKFRGLFIVMMALIIFSLLSGLETIMPSHLSPRGINSVEYRQNRTNRQLKNDYTKIHHQLADIKTSQKTGITASERLKISKYKADADLANDKLAHNSPNASSNNELQNRVRNDINKIAEIENQNN